MWPLAGAVLVIGALLPSVLLWLDGGTLPSLWHTAAAYNAADASFSVAAIALLWIAVSYGGKRGTDSGTRRPAPYPGAWVEPDGHQVVPQGFPTYLALAFVITIILPTLVLIECFLRGSDTIKALAAATLAPYLLVFLPQVLLETVFLTRSVMTPVLPVLYAYYRFWQFIRSLQLVAAVQGAQRPLTGEHAWLVYYLLSLMCFWVFDTGCTMFWLPGMYDWQLQDAQLLTKLSKQLAADKTKQHNEHKGAAANGAADGAVGAKNAGDAGPISSPAMAAKLRHRWRLAGNHRPAASGDMDAYSFGS